MKISRMRIHVLDCSFLLRKVKGLNFTYFTNFFFKLKVGNRNKSNSAGNLSSEINYIAL